VTRSVVALAVAVCLLALAAGSALSGSAVAGDNNARITFEPAESSVEPGETVSVAVVMRSHGAYGDTGVARIDLRIDVPPEYLTVTGVEPASWFEDAPDGDPRGSGDGEISVTTAVDRAPEAGAVRVRQRLENPDDGVTGEARLATVTLRVDEDATTATVEVSATESRVVLTSRYPQPIAAEPPAAVHVAGGGEAVEPPFPEQPFAGDEDANGTTATATSEPGETTGTGGTAADKTGGGSGGDAPEPVGAVVCGVLLGAWLFARRAR
jgi:plastocyanin